MNKRYEQVKNFWNNGLWDERKVRNAVVKEWITAKEFKEITGIEY